MSELIAILRILSVLIIALLGGIIGHSIIPALLAIIVFLAREILVHIIEFIIAPMAHTNLNLIIFMIMAYGLLAIEIIAYTSIVISIF